MKRSLALIISTALTTTVGLVIFVAGLSTIAGPAEGGNSENLPETSGVISAEKDLQRWKAEVEATAQIADRQIEATIQARELALQDQVSQRQHALAKLDETSQAQVAEIEARIAELLAQIEQTTTYIQATEGQVGAIQQAIQADNDSYNNELATLANFDDQLHRELETASALLDAAYSELAQRQTAASTMEGSGGGGNYSDDDYDDNYHGDYEDDDDYEEHEDNDDDD